ncbi:LysR family transcriptional regulator [Streptomyces sp. JJ36]|uniref:LysR family transcriptional regulator n=1 Tax=Streptomyces sp. JJ36 TaxID=2736645 RepID=UPI001F394187|nr:LysR family transcriptional regulator [Streptomyces sp. JJ36]MCF6522165.1 LysR family transcriptional regulator [Streptomyces sp. JJ36]
MDLALLRTFLAVHRAGSFTRGAALLGLSQPAVTAQIRTLEGRLGRPLFHRGARGVTPTAAGEELARKVAPHLDALTEIAETGLADESADRTVHLAGPPEFTGSRAVPALAPLVEQGLTLRVAYAATEKSLESLSAGHCDLALTTARPRGRPLDATPLCDEELVLVTAPRWLERVGGPAAVQASGPRALDAVPALSVHETMPLMTRYWTAVFDTPLDRSAAVIAPGLRAVLESVTAGAGMAVLPRWLCAAALDAGEVTALLDPPLPPLRTYFLTVRTGTLALPHIARTHDWLLRAAAGW